MKKWILFLSSSVLWGVQSDWIGSIPDSDKNLVLNAGSNINVILKKIPVQNQSQASEFGKNGGTNLALSSNGQSASLTLTKDSSLASMQFYHNVGNTISVSNNAQLTISLGKHDYYKNTFLLAGGIIQVGNGGKWELNGAYLLKIGSDGGNLIVNQGGSVEVVWLTEVKITTKRGKQSGIVNNGGDIVLKTEYGVFNSSFNTDPLFPSGSSDGAGVITHNSGTTTIRHREDGKESRFYNAGYGDLGTATSKNRHALLEINGGEFNVVGNLYNGGKNGGSGGAGVGWIVGKGGVINVSNTLYNTSQDSTLPSKIDLYNATIRTKNLENRINGEIYLKDQAKIESAIFTSTKDSKIYFIGSGSGFGNISATQSITLDGEEFFQAGLLNTIQDYKYLIANSPSTSGFQIGDITLQDISGNISNRYTAKLVQEGNNTYIQLTAIGTVTPPTPPTPTPTPTPTPNTPSFVSNTHSIQTELEKKHPIFTQETLDSTTQTILSQIEQTQALKSITTYSISNLYNRTTQAQITRPAPRLAFNPYTHTQSDFLPTPLLERSTPYSFFINFIGGAFGYEGSVGGNYGANFGIDGFVSENLFLGGYSVILGKSLESEGVKIQGLQAEIGGYARAILSSWEFDTTLSYTLLHNSTQRAFSLYGQTFSQEASYNTNFFNLEERVGYRFTLTPSDTLKPYAGVGLHLYYQPSYSESGDFTYSQNSLFFGSFALLAGLEYRKVFSSSSLYLGATLGYSIPSFGDTTYSMHFLDSLLVFKHSPIFTAQIQGGAEFAITPTSYLSVELNYKYNDTRYFDADGILGYRYLF